VTVPCLRDNFSFIIGAQGSRQVAVVDPSEAGPVQAVLDDQGLELVAILNTHHHRDHVGGNAGLLARFPDIPVYAHASDRERIPEQTVALEEGSVLEVAGLRFNVLFIPGHTRGHIAYTTDGAAFIGDTVFGAGCGKLFEGTAAQLYEAIHHKIARLADDTRLYFAHEYTAANLVFALHVEPDNPAIHQRLREVQALRVRGEWTSPSLLSLEKATNPFLRVEEPSVIEHVRPLLQGDTSPLQVFTALRKEKDQFKPSAVVL
jgi:hydroxyacylglutathione hydrolase